MRDFEVVSRCGDMYVKLPERSTIGSAGYDFFAIEDIDIEPSIVNGNYKKPTLVKTGVKARMQNNEVLLLCNRSSNPGKKNLILANSIGVVDSSYYNNFDIGFLFYNIGSEVTHISKGDKLGQGIFMQFLIVDGDDYNYGVERTGGFGSTGK